MSFLYVIVAAVIAYLLGSIPTSVWYGEAYYGIDIRNFGSGNAGASNTFRTFGRRAGAIVLLIDVLKGWTATMLAFMLFFVGSINELHILHYKLLLGFLAIVGHLFPIFVNFKGGKGVATSLGMAIAVQPDVAGLCMIVFLIVALSTHYMSLSSMLAAVTFPLVSMLNIFRESSALLIIYGFLVVLVVVIAHHKNIKRLINGTESKIYLLGKRA